MQELLDSSRKLFAHLWDNNGEQHVAFEEVTVSREVTQQHESHVEVAHVEDLRHFRNDVTLKERGGKERLYIAQTRFILLKQYTTKHKFFFCTESDTW